MEDQYREKKQLIIIYSPPLSAACHFGFLYMLKQ